MAHERRSKAPQSGRRTGSEAVFSEGGRTRTDLREKIGFLETPATYGSECGQVDTRETRMSWVFLTADFVYKLKKPVRLPHLDFSTLHRRRFFCEEELRLNRRLAPETYLGLVPLRRDRVGRLCLGGPQERVVDWLIKMRRLPQEDMLDHRIEHGTLVPADIAELAATLVTFYRSLPTETNGAEAYALHLRREQEINRETLLQHSFGIAGPAADVVGRVDALISEALPLIKGRFEARAILEGHGDLRPEHVCLSEPPQIIDCLEFSRTMRIVDPYDEVGYLGMECDMLGAEWIRPQLEKALSQTGILPPPPALKRLYAAFRCLLRARLSILHLLERPIRHPAKWRPLALRYLKQAEREMVSPQSR